MRSSLVSLVLVLAATSGTWAQDPYGILAAQKSPFLQLDNESALNYEVPVEVSGNKLLWILSVTKQLHLETPRFVERVSESGDFTLGPANPAYPDNVVADLTNELMPFQMFFTNTREAHVAEVARLRSRTTATLTTEEVGGQMAYRIEILPKGDAIQTEGYVFPDGGRQIHRTIRSVYRIATDTGAMKSVTSSLQVQDENADGTPRGAPKDLTVKYRADYATVQTRVVPTRIVFARDEVDEFEQRIRYRVEDGSTVVFEQREVDYFLRDKRGLRATLTVDYGPYQFGQGG